MPEEGKELYELTELESPILDDDILLMWSTGEQGSRIFPVMELSERILDLTGLAPITIGDITEDDLLLVFDEGNQTHHSMRVDEMLTQYSSREKFLIGERENSITGGQVLDITVAAAADISRFSFGCDVIDTGTGAFDSYIFEYSVRPTEVIPVQKIKDPVAASHSDWAEFSSFVQSGLVRLRYHSTISAPTTNLQVNFFNVSMD